MADFHPELRAARFLPVFSFGPGLTRFVRSMSRFAPRPRDREVWIEDVTIPNEKKGGTTRVRVYRRNSLGGQAAPPNTAQRTPALLWIHGGGFVFGKPEQDELSSINFVKQLGIVVAAVDYRLAPEHPFPAALDDCYAALTWLAAQPDIDPKRIAIGGASAGGGLAAALALLAQDRFSTGDVTPAFQLLVYPMLDDRTTQRRDLDGTGYRMWSAKSNRYGWGSYLGDSALASGGGGGLEPHKRSPAPEYAAPARRADLSSLPPAWLGVGTLDLFYDEDLDYAKRLKDAGVPCELYTIPGAFHAFELLFPKTAVARDFFQSQVSALRRALLPNG